MTDNNGARSRAALAGRLPIVGGERIYTRYSQFFFTCIAFSAATWAFLVGSALPYVGDTKIAMVGFFCGYVVGIVPVVLASGLPSLRYGVDTIDAVKSSFGRYGMVLPLLGLVAMLCGWTYVLVALTARGAGNVIQAARQVDGQTPEWLITVIGVVAAVGVWLLVSRGPRLLERLSNWVGPAVVLVSVVMLGVLLWKFGVRDLVSTNVPAQQAFTTNEVQAFAYAAEFGVAAALTWWPVVGGITRMVRSRRHVMSPLVVGGAVLGGAFIVGVAAFGAVTTGSADPTIWMIRLAGSVVGSLSMAVILVANIATMVIMIYISGVAIQQIRLFARLSWIVVTGLLTLPGLLVAFRTEWVLSKVMTWLSYSGMIFAGIVGVTLVDYFVLRRQRLDIAHLYAHSANGKYWFWGGVNWVAVAVTAASMWLYLWMYDPITLETQPAFQVLGAGLPTILVSALVYYALSRLISIPLGKGGYPAHSEVAGAVQTTDEAALQELRVRL